MSKLLHLIGVVLLAHFTLSLVLGQDREKWHPTLEDMQKAVAEILDNLPGYKEQLETLLPEKFHLTSRFSTIVVGVGLTEVAA